MAVKLGYCFVLLASIELSGCGTYVPEIEEFWGSPDDVSIKVNAITSQVKCELGESVRSLLADDASIAKRDGTPTQLDWLRDWGAQVTLTLTIAESTAVNPGASINNVLDNATTTFGKTVITSPQSFSMGLGVSGSSAATRTDTLTAVYKLSDFAKGGPKGFSCIPVQTANGFLFVQSDLKLKQWLYEALLPQFTGVVQYPSNSNANVKNGFITHDVKFEVVTGANATPSWKLVRVTANTQSPFFTTSRDRTQDLLITLGPLQSEPPQPKGVPTLATAAQNSHLAQQIGEAVATSLQNLQQPFSIIQAFPVITGP